MPITPGETVTIYEDPFTRFKPEGQAMTIDKLATGPDGEELWVVRFIGETETYQRLLYDK